MVKQYFHNESDIVLAFTSFRIMLDKRDTNIASMVEEEKIGWQVLDRPRNRSCCIVHHATDGLLPTFICAMDEFGYNGCANTV